MRDFVITTDSNSDLPKDYLTEKGIGIIPHYYDIDQITYGGDHELTVKEFYDKMRAGSVATTTASNPAVIRETFSDYAARGFDILHISFSSALSGGYNNICMGAAEIREAYPQAQILVHDTLNVSLGQGLAIMKAVQMKEAGHTIGEIYTWLEEHRNEFCVQFTVEDLRYLYRGGRISKTTAIVGSMISVKPILYVNPEGKLVSLSSVRGRHMPDMDRMCLVRADDVLRPAPKKRRCPSEILLYVFLPVSPGEAPVHAPQIPFADASGTHGHQMADHAGLADRRKGQISRAVFFI